MTSKSIQRPDTKNSGKNGSESTNPQEPTHRFWRGGIYIQRCELRLIGPIELSRTHFRGAKGDYGGFISKSILSLDGRLAWGVQ